MLLNKFITVENILVSSEISEAFFACNLAKCKGACCTLESEYGAPLLKEEISEIEKCLSFAKEFLSQNHLNEIEKNGFYEKKENSLVTKSINNKSCVFVYEENNIAKCSLEKAFTDGKTNFRKPISCHLFPIRASSFGGDVLRYEKFNECSSALENGIKKNIRLIDFCKEPLERYYSKDWFLTLKKNF